MQRRSCTPSTSRQRRSSITIFQSINNATKDKNSQQLHKFTQINQKILQFKLKQKSYLPYLTLIKKSIRNIQIAESDQIKLKEKSNLSKILNTYHQVFNKIQYTICLKIVLNCFFRKYQTNQQIPLNNLSIGFLIYGKILLKNEQSGFQAILKDQQVINQQLIVDQKYGIPTVKNPKLYVLYDAIALSQCVVLWLQSCKVEQIRHKCFTDFDLKKKYHNFENVLRVFMIKKKLKVDTIKQF